MQRATTNAAWRAAITDSILEWGPLHFQPFPWREDDIPAWQGLLAEVFLQRTRAAQATPAFERLRSRYPTPDALGRAGPEEIAGLIRPLGLHRRAPRVYALASQLEESGGTIPLSLQGLQALPGVGPYVAAATLSLHLDRRAVLIDTNIVRVLGRLAAQAYGPETRRARWMREFAGSLTPQDSHRTYNYGLLDLAMTICTRRAPRCPECPLVALCATAAGGTQPNTR